MRSEAGASEQGEQGDNEVNGPQAAPLNGLLPLCGPIGHNPGMGRRWPWLAMLVWMFCGCSPTEEPQQTGVSGTVAKPQADPSGEQRVDAFNLPLIIHVEVPEVPPEIENPSPPIK